MCAIWLGPPGRSGIVYWGWGMGRLWRRGIRERLQWPPLLRGVVSRPPWTECSDSHLCLPDEPHSVVLECWKNCSMGQNKHLARKNGSCAWRSFPLPSLLLLTPPHSRLSDPRKTHGTCTGGRERIRKGERERKRMSYHIESYHVESQVFELESKSSLKSLRSSPSRVSSLWL